MNRKIKILNYNKNQKSLINWIQMLNKKDVFKQIMNRMIFIIRKSWKMLKNPLGKMKFHGNYFFG